MTLLPIVERELRVRSRRKSTHRFRLFAASVGILLVTLVLIQSMARGPAGGLGHPIFSLLSWLCFLFCLFEGPRNTSDALSQEKREGTLGLLFLTDLRGYDIVLGKLAATSLNSVYGLLAVFPPLAVPLVLGGVTGGEFWRVVLALLNTLFFSLCAGMCISAASRNEKKTWAYSSSLMSLIALIPPFLLLVPNRTVSMLGLASPTAALLSADDAAFLATPERFWISLALIHGLSWVLLIAAGFVLPRKWQDRPSFLIRSSPPGKAGGRSGNWSGSTDSMRQAHPVSWLASKYLASNRALWALVITASAAFVIAWSLGQGNEAVAVVLFASMYVLHLTLAVWLASDACHLMSTARDSGALELLLATPVTEREIVNGHWAGLRRRFVRPLSTLVAVEALIISAQFYVLAAGDIPIGACVALAAIVFFVVFVSLLDLPAVASYGMWMGLKQPRAARAVTSTVLHVLLLPMFSLACYPLYPVVGLVKNLIIINHGREQVRKNLRVLVTDRFCHPGMADLVSSPAVRPQNPLPPVLPR